jgi:hypothetical protein
MRRLFRRRRKPANQRTVEVVLKARDEFTPVLEELTRKLAEVEAQALRTHEAAWRASRAAEGGKHRPTRGPVCGEPDEEY